MEEDPTYCRWHHLWVDGPGLYEKGNWTERAHQEAASPVISAAVPLHSFLLELLPGLSAEMGCLGYCSIAVERHHEDTYEIEHLIGDLLTGTHMCLRFFPAYIIPLPVSNYRAPTTC